MCRGECRNARAHIDDELKALRFVLALTASTFSLRRSSASLTYRRVPHDAGAVDVANGLDDFPCAKVAATLRCQPLKEEYVAPRTCCGDTALHPWCWKYLKYIAVMLYWDGDQYELAASAIR